MYRINPDKFAPEVIDYVFWISMATISWFSVTKPDKLSQYKRSKGYIRNFICLFIFVAILAV